MKSIVTSKRFDKKLIRFCTAHPDMIKKVQMVIQQLSKNHLEPKLKTHRLKGSLKDCFAASVDYSYRIIFEFDDNNIYLLNIGSHDEVY